MNANSRFIESDTTAIRTRQLNLWYGLFQALFDVDLDVRKGAVTALIGPSGCGKTTLLRSVNRINERLGYARITGSIEVMGENIYGPDVELVQVRKQIGMVFQRPNPLPISIRENVLFGHKIHSKGQRIGRKEQDEIVEKALRQVLLWDEVKDQLDGRAINLSLEKQQKLCISAPSSRATYGPADGRALFGSGSERYGGGGRVDLGFAWPVHDFDRHPQHGAGKARE